MNLIEEKSRVGAEFHSKQINRREHRRRTNNLGKEFQQFYGTVVSGLHDRLSEFGSVVPITSAELAGQKNRLSSRRLDPQEQDAAVSPDSSFQVWGVHRTHETKPTRQPPTCSPH